MATRILIADDDPIHRRNLEAIVMRMGYRTILADGGTSALSFVGQRKDIVAMLLDLSMPDMDGLTVLRRMREAGHSVPVIVLVQNDDLQPVLQAMKLGAVDFVTKPLAFERVQVSVSNVLKIEALTKEIRRARSSLKAHLTLSDMAIKSPEMEQVRILARRASALDAPLLIEGEPGSGKETLARAICSGSDRRRGPFVAVDCRTLTKDNADEILFGFSAARRDSDSGDAIQSLGKLAEADGGTLFLDEVGALPRHTQIKLFAAMQSGQPEAGGEGDIVLSNTRIMASNSQPLADLVYMGRFHAGLCHLLGSFTVTMPPLRNRLADIPLLLHQFMMHYVSEERLGHITGITTHALEKLKAYHWPGNVRELKNAVYRAVLLCETSELTVADFAQIGAETPAAGTMKKAGRFNLVDHDPNVSASAGLFSGIDGAGEVRTLAATEEEMIRFALAHYDGQISEVARRLGIGRTTLYRKLKEYGIDVASISGKASDEEEEGENAPFNRAAS